MGHATAGIDPRRRLAWAVAEVRAAFGSDWRLPAMTLVAFGAASVCALIIAKLLDDVMGGDDTARLDPTIVEWVADRRTDSLTRFFRTVTHLADPWVVVGVTLAAVVVLALMGRGRLALFVALSVVGAAAATGLAKLVVGRARPPVELWVGVAPGPAFPSGHATQSVALYGALAVAVWVLWQGWVLRIAVLVGAAVIAFLVGSSRVYLAVHWPSDVLCGWAVATLWLALLLLVGWFRPLLRTAWTNRARSGSNSGSNPT